MKNIKNLFLLGGIIYFVNHLSLEEEDSGTSIIQRVLEQCNSAALSDEECMENIALVNKEHPTIMQILIEQCKEDKSKLECIAFIRAKYSDILQRENVSNNNNDTQE